MDKSIQAAQQLIDYGLTPIPLQGKRPIIKNWPTRFLEESIKHDDVINGIGDSDGKIITFTNKNIGIVTGKISNCIVLDIDDISELSRLEELGDFPLTWKVRSNRGIHLYFNYNNNIPSMKLWNSIDILSDKKQVVAPPSLHPSGTIYKWELSPKQVEKAELPSWFVEYILKYYRQKTSDGSSAKKIHSNKVYKKTNTFKTNNISDLLININWLDFYSRFTCNIRGSGEWLSSKCPFHKDQHNSFSFNNNDGGWICFAGCGSGSGIQAVQALYNLDFQQAVKIIKGEDVLVQ